MSDARTIKVKCLVFDLDNTLYNEFDFFVKRLKKVAEFLSELKLDNKQILFSKMLQLYDRFGREKLFNYLLREYNANDRYLLEKAILKFRTAKVSLSLFPDAKETLSFFKHKIDLCLITDGVPIVQRSKIRSLSLESVFDVIIVTDELGSNFRKPSFIPFYYLMELKKYSPKDFVYIGDDPLKDFYGAKMMGFHTIHINRKGKTRVKYYKNVKADIVINSLVELKDIVTF